MVRHAALPLALLLGCAHAEPMNTAAPASPELSCAAASLVVLRGLSASGPVDVVETEREILASPALRRAMEQIAPDAVSRAQLQVNRKGRTAVLSVEACAAQAEGAMATCSAALDAAFSFGKEGLEFLQEQERSLAADLAVRERVLRELEESRELTVVPASLRLAHEREKLAQLEKEAGAAKKREPGLEASLLRARSEAASAAEVDVEWQRRTRDVEEVGERLKALRGRLSDASLTGIAQQDLRILAGCGPCPTCRHRVGP